MIDIPVNDTRSGDFEAKVDKVCEAVVRRLNYYRARKYKCISVFVKTEYCYGGGNPMPMIYEIARRFVERGWFCYLVRGGNYNNWTWLDIRNTEHTEGFTEANIPDYYRRVR